MIYILYIYIYITHTHLFALSALEWWDSLLKVIPNHQASNNQKTHDVRNFKGRPFHKSVSKTGEYFSFNPTSILIMTGWWFQRFFIFTPQIGEDEPILTTLQGTNISPKNGILKMIFLFPRWDMLIPWRVIFFRWVGSTTNQMKRKTKCPKSLIFGIHNLQLEAGMLSFWGKKTHGFKGSFTCYVFGVHPKLYFWVLQVGVISQSFGLFCQVFVEGSPDEHVMVSLPSFTLHGLRTIVSCSH